MEDIAFPRGGRAVPKPDEEPAKEDRKKKRKATETASPDFLFGSKPDAKTATKKTKSAATTDVTTSKQSLLPLGGGGVVIPQKGKGAAPIIESLSFNKLSKGTKVLGCVREVQDEFAVVALPNLLTGYILASDVPLKQCVHVGQILTVSVQKVATETLPGGASKKRIQVSALPTHVNPKEGPQTLLRGQIVSVEDHGCLVDLGFGRRGFIKFDQVQGEYQILEAGETSDTKSRILQPGRLFDFIPGKVDSESTVIPLSLPSLSTLIQQVITPPSTKHSASYTLGSLLPGMMVTAKVEALAKNGLCVTFLGNVFRGAIELGSHMGGHEFRLNETDPLDSAWRKIFDHHQHFPARIIAIDVPTKLIRLSLAPHVLTLKPHVDSPEVGAIFEDCTVVRVDQGIGALLALPKEHHQSHYSLPKKIKSRSDLFQNEAFQKAMEVPAVYVHISKAYDEEGKKKDSRNELNAGQFAKDFSLGSKHSVRVLNTGHWMDGVTSGGCSPAILQAHVLTHADLQPGQLYKQVPVCAKLGGGSILVNLGGSPGNPVRGLIPSPLHLMDTQAKSSSDFRKKVIDTKFAVDAKVDVRVLWVDHDKKKCVVTAKKSLVKCEPDHVVTSYSELQVGQTATGFVSKLDDRAVYVTFYNRVYGKVTAKSLAAELGIENHKENYQVGDVVTCRVVKITKTNKHQTDLDEEEDVEMDDSDSRTKAFYQVLLSLKIQDPTVTDDAMDEDNEDGPKQPKKVHIKAGAILPEKSLKILELFKGKQRAKHFVPGYAIVSVKAKYLLDEPERQGVLPQIECKLPFDQLMDDYDPADIESPEALDALATSVLRVGKKINQKALVLTDPRKTDVDHASGIGKLTVVSLRKSLISTMEATKEGEENPVLIPSPTTHLYVGALVQGYVAQIDSRHGAFLRFLDGMTGLIPRMNGGLVLAPYSTIVAQVQVIDDTVRPFRIMLQPINGVKQEQREFPFKVGDVIAKAQVKGIQFLEATLDVCDESSNGLKDVKVRIHASMKEAKNAKIQLRKPQAHKNHFVKGHPFFGLKTNDTLTNLTVVWVGERNGKVIVQVTDRKVVSEDQSSTHPTFVSSRSQLKSGMTVKVVVSEIHERNKGLEVMVSPTVRGYIPGLELSTNLDVLNDITSHVPRGARLTCVVMDDSQWHENRAKSPFASRTQKSWSERKSTPEDKRHLFLSVLAVTEPTLAIEKPTRNEVIIGRINRRLPQYQPPSLMLVLRGGYLARCCITEMAESDDWENMPLGRPQQATSSPKAVKENSSRNKGDEDDSSDSSSDESQDEDQKNDEMDETFQDGKYVQCRVLKSFPKLSLVDVSLRASRVEGDLDDDEAPVEGETVQAYVVETNKKGCFVRLARHIEGRATLTELCDGYLHDPKVSFPPGRLVVGKVKAVSSVEKKSKSSKNIATINVDLDMRESTILESKKALTYEEIEIQGKYKGTVTRVESYGVFVQIDNSKVSGLVHLSECSDKFVKNLAAIYNPGDPVKVLVIKKDDEEKKIGFSMKASHFEGDEDSDDESSVEEMEEESDEEQMSDIDNLITSNSKKRNDDDLDSDDENFVGKLAAKMEKDDEEGSKEQPDGSDSNGADSSDSDSDDDDDDDDEAIPALDTDVGFDWGFKGKGGDGTANPKDEQSSDESDASDSEDDGDDNKGKGSSHKSRKKQAQRRREEQDISKREFALADGTADENPETAGDFERLLAGNPNSSELWIRYMAFYLSLADIPAARLVADKALDRIEFREEREKLNVWTALLTLEHKYGNEETLQKTITRACSQNNPKQVHLRVCEILEKDLSTPESVSRADSMYAKMCSKFKSKKKVWLAHLSYLLKQSRHDEAHALLKRALLSLAPYKHAEIMSRFAQLEFEFGSQERARTLFDGIITKHPKRLDLFFVYVDKEVKFGSLETARNLFEDKVKHGKLTDKQMKSVFKKWYRMEELHGTEESMEHVKESARNYVQQASNS